MTTRLVTCTLFSMATVLAACSRPGAVTPPPGVDFKKSASPYVFKVDFGTNGCPRRAPASRQGDPTGTCAKFKDPADCLYIWAEGEARNPSIRVIGAGIKPDQTFAVRDNGGKSLWSDDGSKRQWQFDFEAVRPAPDKHDVWQYPFTIKSDVAECPELDPTIIIHN